MRYSRRPRPGQQLRLCRVASTTRTIRRYRFEPIPEVDLDRMWSSTRAPPGTNRQPFRFVVLRDSDTARAAKALLGDAFRRGWRSKCDAEGASIFPACQNLALAARALGYGACFSGWHVAVEDELRELLAIPQGFELGVELSLTITQTAA